MHLLQINFNYMHFTFFITEFILLAEITTAAIREINIRDSCGKHELQNMTDAVSYIVRWDGRALPSPSCKHSFMGYTEIYTVCFEVLKFEIGDCGVQLIYREDPGASSANFTCEMLPGPWCAAPGSVAHIELQGADVNPVNTTGFQIMVIATTEDKDMYLKLGIVISVAIFIGIVFGVMLYCIRRRSDRESEIMSTGYTKFGD